MESRFISARRRYMRLEALLTMASAWSYHFRQLLLVVPSNVHGSLNLNLADKVVVDGNVRQWWSISLHLLGLNFRMFFSVHAEM